MSITHRHNGDEELRHLREGLAGGQPFLVVSPAMIGETGELRGSEGRVFYHCWRPVADARAVALIVHGYAEHGGRYAHLAAALVDEGFAVYAPDHIGHGRSEGERALLVDFEHVVDDLRALASLAQSLHGELPLVMIGHSMGGLLTARYAERYPEQLAGAAFLGAVLGDWKWAREVLSYAELPPSDSNPNGMSRDPEVCRAYAEDPLVYHGTYKRPLLVAEVACLDRFNAEIGAISMPVAFFHGSDDPFVPFEDSKEAVERMPSTDKEFHIYEGARHELVNELNRDEVLADVVGFAKRVTSS